MTELGAGEVMTTEPLCGDPTCEGIGCTQEAIDLWEQRRAMPERAEEPLTDQLVIRVPASLREALEKDARDNGRTIAQSVRFHLRKALNV